MTKGAVVCDAVQARLAGIAIDGCEGEYVPVYDPDSAARIINMFNTITPIEKPTNNEERYYTGLWYRCQRMYDDAVVCWGSAVAEGDIPSMVALGESYFKKEDYMKAKKYFHRAADAGSIFAWHRLRKYYEKTEPDADRVALCDVGAVHAGDTSSCGRCADYFYNKGDLDKAEEYLYHNYKDWQPDDKDVIQDLMNIYLRSRPGAHGIVAKVYRRLGFDDLGNDEWARHTEYLKNASKQ